MLMNIDELKVETMPVSTLKPYANNPRTHSPKQIAQIAMSIKTFGFTNPILVDHENGVIAGHGRLEAAKKLGIREVPVIHLENMSDAQKRAYILADNKLAENAGWDREILAIELQGLLEMDLGFEITTTGFEMGEIDVLIGELGDDAIDEADQIPEIDETATPISQFGDLWALGTHRLLCGDALQKESYEQLLGGEKAELVFTDPPYNVKIDGHVSGLGKHAHDEFAMASGEMSEAQFTQFLEAVFQNLAHSSVDGSIQFVCMDWRHLYELLSAGRAAYSEFKNLCVWTKSNGGMGSLYRSQHELVAVFKSGSASHINNVDLGRHGRYRTNVWAYAGMNGFRAGRDEALAMHPTVKPVALVEDAILDCSNRGSIVLDAFAGSGTTIIAAERAGRRGYGIELDPAYVDVTLKRFRDLTGQEPIHIKSGLTFSELS
ncbi:ParB N-terminal domain-containing protein [bacterium AH-315-P15]|nr:ParB N-terminal domain-containing protein [bacterium AH-315-P15]